MEIPEEAEKFYKKAKNEIEDKKYNDALTSLHESLKIYPDYAEALSLTGYVHYKLKFKKKTKNDVYTLTKKALSLNDASKDVWFQMGNANTYLNKFDKAIVCYEKAHKLGYRNEKFYNNIGAAYLKKGDYNKALEYFNEGMKISDRFPPLLNSLGYLNLVLGNYDTAVQQLNMAINCDPTYSAPYVNLGNVEIEKGNYKNAIDYFDKALEIDSENVYALSNTASVHILLKAYDKAKVLFKKSIKIEPEFSDHWLNLGSIYSREKKYNKAMEYYDKALELNSYLYKAWYNKGNAYIELNELTKAINAYRESLKINPEYSEALFNLGSTYLKVKNFTEAEKCFLKGLEKKEDSLKDLFNLGNCYRFKGAFNDAINYFQRVINIDPNHFGAWYNQGICYLMIKDYEMSISCLVEAINIIPNDRGVWGNLGMAYIGKFDHENGIRCFKKVIEIYPEDVLALNSLGQIYIQKGEIKKAIKYLKEALEIEPLPLLKIDALGYEVFINKAEDLEGKNDVVFPYTPDIYASIGMAYHSLGNNIEAMNYLNLAIESDPNNFIGHANLGILYLNLLDFSKAISEFDIALKIIEDKGLKQEIKGVLHFKKISESGLKLKPKLNLIDSELDDLFNVEDIKIFRNKLIETNKKLIDFFNKIDIEELPIGTKDLLLAKKVIFNSLNEALNFSHFQHNFENIQHLFSSKTEFNVFFYSYQNLNDVLNILKGYSNLEEIPENVKDEILQKLRNLRSLGSELTKLITGSISHSEIQSEIKKSRRNRSGIGSQLILNNAIQTNFDHSFILDNFDINYINQICIELAEKIPKYKNTDLEASDYMRFLKQFPESLRECAADLLTKIKFIKFDKMISLILDELSKVVEDPKKAYLISFKNGWQKSQEIWIYFSDKNTDEKFNIIKAEDLKDLLSKINSDEDYTLIFLDDVIGTGKQFIDNFNDECSNIIDDIKKIQLSHNNINLYLVSGVGSFKAQRLISKKIEVIDKNSIRFGISITENDLAFSDNNFSDPILKNDMIYFLKNQHPVSWEGYKGSQYLIVLEWNTPDNTIGCLRKDINNNWKALFPRN